MKKHIDRNKDITGMNYIFFSEKKKRFPLETALPDKKRPIFFWINRTNSLLFFKLLYLDFVSRKKSEYFFFFMQFSKFIGV